ncbi:molybdopterin molybdotransferase MoeA [Trichlorobacter lovleyi]|uniref:Molybdopterin molybdenumtransferase n=1 Tax=Trichlorobacter lovleyi (strain ATCC BAA-1151 / DSM 17278 / SZ) TaxID=398767 RepID=B3EAB3_TRIL1|nr:gephyrin-like molybdotransferase Glp [Trichlorobacter lovleyi]ACD93941.1 molybdenum cofactor synthesis domain protein [Trichlorobacter lovleyi SZ]
MISIEDAQQIIQKHITGAKTIEASLLDSLGRVIAEDVYAPWDIPTSDNSAMDGYAFSSLSERNEFRVAAEFIPAGSQRIAPVGLGEAVRIMTGAPVPPGCDTVVPIEDVEQIPSGIRLKNEMKPGAHIRLRGEDVEKDELVLAKGSAIRPQEIGLLVSLGKTTIKVFRPARVAILATGDELQEAGSVPDAGRIINSNSYSLAAQVLDAGGEAFMIGIAADTAQATEEKIREGLKADMLITTGGVSVGDRDFVKESIQNIGGSLLFWKVNMKPGKPVAFAVLEDKPVFALPGNPVAAMVAFEMFVRPAMLLKQGCPRIYRPRIKAVLVNDVRNRGDRPHLVRVKVTLDHGEYHASIAGNQSSANLASLTQSNGLLHLIPNSSLTAGSRVEVILLDREFEMGCA